MYRAAIPDSNHVKTTAQLTDGADSWASPNSFSARQLWERMPVDIFVQTCGTTNEVADMSDLTGSGVKLGLHPSSNPSSCSAYTGICA